MIYYDYIFINFLKSKIHKNALSGVFYKRNALTWCWKIHYIFALSDRTPESALGKAK